MPESEAKKRWKRENTIMIGLNLNKKTDKDIIDYLQDKPKQTEIKRLIRKEIESNK